MDTGFAPIDERTQVCFESAEDAWFWAHRMRRNEQAGRRPAYSDRVPARPCTHYDIFNVLRWCFANRPLTKLHANALQEAADLGHPPFAWTSYTAWREALKIFEPALRFRGIVR